MERRVYRYETVGSTNTELMALARQGAAEGTVVLARQQTAGRGRMGRSFQSPAGLGLYGSVLLRSRPEDAPRIPALAATAVRRAIRRSCGLSCGIKWPNDLVLSGRKVCGILAEALPGPEGSLWVVVGIGINVCQRREDFLPELRETAASLSMIAGAEIDRAALETAFLEELEALHPDRIILSPGPGRPEDAGILIETVLKLGPKIPILGVCLGHQAICAAYGATVTYAKILMHGKSSQAAVDFNCPLFKGCPPMTPVARYHSLAVDAATLPECLTTIAHTEDGEVMGVKHRDYPIYGVQFHPESILTPRGKDMLKNFIALSKEGAQA